MNKDVFNYLSEKAHDVTDYIKAKAEAVGTYLEDHATDIKDGIVKGTATVLTTAMLLGGMTGCDVVEQIGQPKLEQFEQLPIRPVDEIEQTGIKAEDVLALYDDLAEKCVEAHHSTTSWKDNLGDRFDDLDGQFVSITPSSNFMDENYSNYTMPFYAPLSYFQPSNRWIISENGEYFNPDPTIWSDKIYRTDLDVNCNLDGNLSKLKFNWGIYEQDLVNVLSAFNVQSFTLTEEYCNSIPNFSRELFVELHQSNMFGRQVYNPFTIDRKTIETANTEQLWALYNMLDNMIKINFECQLPDFSEEPTIN